MQGAPAHFSPAADRGTAWSMRRIFVSCVILAVATGGCSKKSGDEADAEASGAGLAFLNGFEGEIDAFARGKQQPQTPITAFVKGGKLRFDIPESVGQGSPASMLGPKAYAIFDSGAKKLYVVSDMQKQVIVIDLNKSGEQLKGVGGPHQPGGGGAQQPQVKLTKTGKYDTVAGYKCENWDVTSDHREGTVCVAHEGVSWFSVPMTGIPTERLWMAELLDGKHFPLRFVGYDKDGNTEESRVEVTKIDKRSLPASQFEYPPTYRVVDLAQMMAGFGAIPSGMPPPPHAGPPHRPH
jgi:hypothetical protein